VNLRYAKGNLDEYLKEIPAAVVTDAKCVYDAMRSESSNLGMRERRTSIELKAAREECEATSLELIVSLPTD
jgi:hypothetical protein